ncbi:MAG TPA: ABC transporter permease [Vicinamibacterales bacterium]|nr:ABC transporter permease [Vicinamibacterales bacterium]
MRCRVSAERHFFDIVGQRPALGRAFRLEDDRAGAPRVAILAHTTWQSRYGGDPSILGRTVRINDVPSTVIGVMPPGFHFSASAEVWVPVGQIASASTNSDAARGNRPPLVLGLGRLADGVDFSQARAEMNAITSRLASDHPQTNEGISASLEPLDGLLRGAMRGPVLMVMGAVSFVLLIACVNVANLALSVVTTLLIVVTAAASIWPALGIGSARSWHCAKSESRRLASLDSLGQLRSPGLRFRPVAGDVRGRLFDGRTAKRRSPIRQR